MSFRAPQIASAQAPLFYGTIALVSFVFTVICAMLMVAREEIAAAPPPVPLTAPAGFSAVVPAQMIAVPGRPLVGPWTCGEVPKSAQIRFILDSGGSWRFACARNAGIPRTLRGERRAPSSHLVLSGLVVIPAGTPPGVAPGKLSGIVHVAVQDAQPDTFSIEALPVSSPLTLTVAPPVVPGPDPVGELSFPDARWWTLLSLAVFLPSAWAYLRVRAAQRRRPTDLPTF